MSALFEDGAARHRRQALPVPIFDLMEKFAEYGFNKSHPPPTPRWRTRRPG